MAGCCTAVPRSPRSSDSPRSPNSPRSPHDDDLNVDNLGFWDWPAPENQYIEPKSPMSPQHSVAMTPYHNTNSIRKLPSFKNLKKHRKQLARRCKQCDALFGIFRWKYTCTQCLHVVCDDCSLHRQRGCNLRVCDRCCCASSSQCTIPESTLVGAATVPPSGNPLTPDGALARLSRLKLDSVFDHSDAVDCIFQTPQYAPKEDNTFVHELSESKQDCPAKRGSDEIKPLYRCSSELDRIFHSPCAKQDAHPPINTSVSSSKGGCSSSTRQQLSHWSKTEGSSLKRVKSGLEQLQSAMQQQIGALVIQIPKGDNRSCCFGTQTSPAAA